MDLLPTIIVVLLLWAFSAWGASYARNRGYSRWIGIVLGGAIGLFGIAIIHLLPRRRR